MQADKSDVRILEFLRVKEDVTYGELRQEFADMSESTLVRNLTKLTEAWSVRKEKNGRNTRYLIIGVERAVAYLSRDFFDRPKATYRSEFLGSYVPNVSSFLWERYSRIQSIVASEMRTLSTLDYQKNLRSIENLLIDLSFSSSRLEGNTYAYLDTEVLVKYGESAEWKTQFETRMILNHKRAIQYIVDHRSSIGYSKAEFCNVHSLLAEGLLDGGALGTIRKGPVQIGGSTYEPIDNPFRLEEEFSQFVAKLSEIRNPFEQAIFVLVFIPYFQAFEDMNKRTSRIAANIPLIKAGLPPMGFLRIREREYINAVLSIYELNETALMADLFVNNWIENFRRYQ